MIKKNQIQYKAPTEKHSYVKRVKQSLSEVKLGRTYRFKSAGALIKKLG